MRAWNSPGLKRHATLMTFYQDIVHGVQVRSHRLFKIWDPLEALGGAVLFALLSFSLWCWYLLVRGLWMLIVGI